MQGHTFVSEVCSPLWTLQSYSATIPPPTLPLVSFCGSLSQLHSLSLITFHGKVQCHSWQVESFYTSPFHYYPQLLCKHTPSVDCCDKVQSHGWKVKSFACCCHLSTLFLWLTSVVELWSRLQAQLQTRTCNWLKALGLLKPELSVRHQNCFQDYRYQMSRITCVPLKSCSDW